jgi:predicted cytidylate kinase
MRIIISGLTASGKSTLAKALSKRLGIEYFSASSKWKELLPKKEFDFWESQKGLDVVKFRLDHLKYDRALDRYILNYVKTHKEIVLDSWVAAWKIYGPDVIKIYLRADVETRAKRASLRNGTSFKDALKFMKAKDKLTSEIYKRLYKIEVEKDFAPFDLVINSTALSEDSVRELCLDYINKRNVR